MKSTVALGAQGQAPTVRKRDSRIPLLWWAWLACAVFGGLILEAAQPNPDDSNLEVTSCGQFYLLSQEQAAAGRAIRFKAVVVCSDREFGELYLLDGTDTLYLDPAKFERRFEPGDAVQLTAKSTNAAGHVEMTEVKLNLVGRTNLPAATRLELEGLGRKEGQWIEAIGEVREADTSSGRLILRIEDKGVSCLVRVLGLPGTNDVIELIGSRVRVRGIDSSQLKDGRLEQALLIVPGLLEVVVIKQAPIKWRELPVMSIDTLVSRELGDWTNQPVHLNGVVAASTPGESLVVRDSTGAIRAEVRQMTPVKWQARVDVWGYLRVLPNETVLSQAFFMVAHPRFQPARVPAAFDPNHAGSINRTNVITEIAKAQHLKSAEAALGIPVRLRGVITFADPELGVGFIQDRSGAVYVNLNQQHIRSGQWVELTGETAPGGYAPEVTAKSVEVLGQTNLPVPVKVELDDLADGAMDSYWIQMVGVVRRMEVDADRATLHLTSRKGRFDAVVRGFNDQATPPDLIDALVSVQGACTSDLNARGQLSGVTLNVPSLAQVNVLEAPPADPFTAQTTAIDSISVFNPDRYSGRRIKLGGVVTLVQKGQGFWMQDGTGGIRIQTQQAGAVLLGDQVEVLGFPAVGEFAPYLEESIWRRTGTGPLPKAERTTAQEILLRGRNDASIVELEAQLLQSVAGSARPKLVLQDGPITFTAQLQTGADGRALGKIEPGSRVRLRGACVIQASEDHEPVAFRLLVAHPKDIVVVEAPPWWTARNTLRVAAGLGLAVVLALVWVAELRKRVRVQTEEIRQKLKERNEFAESLASEKTLLATLIDHLPDMVFVKDTQARYVLTNRAHSRFHGVSSSEQFLGKSSANLVPAELARIYAQTDRQILEEGLPMCEGEEPARNGDGADRWLSTTKVPLKDAQGKVIGLVGISRDITERKEAEAKLDQAHKALVIASREAGMAEVATSVLHNVGNVLNSVNTSANLVADHVKNSALDGLARVAKLIREHEVDLGAFITQDSRGRHVPAFIEHLAQHLEEERRLILSELDSLRQNIEHIKDIVAMQQGYAKAAGVRETVKPAELMEDALRMSASGLARHDIRVERDYDPIVPEIQVEKHKVVQILVNLVRNAKHACQDSERSGKHITVRVADESGRIQFTVTDNGIGILPENLTRIFNHGFTTRKHGHGFGLHSGALAAQELGGSLTVRSQGPGRGASFTLELPGKRGAIRRTPQVG